MVSLVRCEDYAHANAALDELLRPLGGMEAFVRPGWRVLIKPNIVMGASPDKAICTHPAVMAAVCSHVLAAGATPVVGESPGGPYNAAWVNRAMDTSGIWPACKAVGAQRNDNFKSRVVPYPEGMQLRNITLIDVALDCDAIINVCKLKTHGMTLFSGAVKNLFGCVPGTLKTQAHVRFAQTNRFAGQINDICAYLKPALHIMDGVIGMEGDGPTAGTPRAVNVLLAGSNPWEIDHTASGIVGIPHERVPTLTDGAMRGLYTPDGIETLGPPPGEFSCRFKLPVQYKDARFNPVMHFFLSLFFSTKPVAGKNCTGCGICKNSCPPNAITMKNGKPSVDYKKCIKCYCCQELCPQSAMMARRGIFRRADSRKGSRL